jgi:ribulose-phosphate 3-epimerase
MPNAVKLAPSILTADFSRIGEQVQEAERAGADYIHVDVMDGQFVPNITLGPAIVSAIHKSTRLPLDVHLMILEPERQLQAFADAGAAILTVHVEATRHLHRSVQLAKQTGARAGVAINPATPVAMLEDVLQDIDLALVMSVNPGWGGQAFLPIALEKLRRVRQMLEP